MKGFSPRNLKYMRALAEAWSGPEFVQQAAAQLPWFHLCTLLDNADAAAHCAGVDVLDVRQHPVREGRARSGLRSGRETVGAGASEAAAPRCLTRMQARLSWRALRGRACAQYANT